MEKVVLLTNILTPYRIYFYDLLHKNFKNLNIDFRVIVTAETEPNRKWKYNEYKRDYTTLVKGKIITLPNNVFIHINFGVKKLLKEYQPDMVISAGSYLYPALWNVLRLKSKLKCQVFYWSEAHLYEERNYNKIKLFLREKIRDFVFKKFDGFWYSGKLSLDLIQKYSNDNIKKIFVPNLIDNNFFTSSTNFTNVEKGNLRVKYRVKENKIVMICPARLTWVKGQLNFLKIFLESSFHEKFIILLVGDGDLENEIKTFVKDVKSIKILGYKNQQEILELYSISDFLLLPSLSDPNPLTCIEALWSGLPLFVSKNVGNFPEVINHDKNGFTFDYKIANSIPNALARIADKDDKWFKDASIESLNIAEKFYNSETAAFRIVKETNDAF